MIEQVVVECSRAEETSADLVVRATLASKAPTSARLSGVVHGPYSERARTLPATFDLQPSGEDRLQVTIVDPCYSTPELDMHYEVELELTFGGKRIAHHQTPLVLRRMVYEIATHPGSDDPGS